MFLLVPVAPFFSDKTKEYNAHMEYFMHDVGLISYFTDQWSLDEHKWKRIENFVVTHLAREEHVRDILYRRTKNQTEIDCIVKTYDGNIVPVEVKSWNKTLIPRAFRSFNAQYWPLLSGIVTSESVKMKQKMDWTDLFIQPYWNIGEKFKMKN